MDDIGTQCELFRLSIKALNKRGTLLSKKVDQFRTALTDIEVSKSMSVTVKKFLIRKVKTKIEKLDAMINQCFTTAWLIDPEYDRVKAICDSWMFDDGNEDGSAV